MVGQATQAEKDFVKREFQNLFRIVYDDEISVSLTNHAKGQELAHINAHNANYVRLYIRWKSWHKNSDERNLLTLIHELSHVDHDNHKIEFWKTYAHNFLDAEHNRDQLEGNYNWDEAARQLVKSAIPSRVDRRQTTVGEMRGRLEDILGVKVDGKYSRQKYQAKFDDQGRVDTHLQSTMPSLLVSEEVAIGSSVCSKKELWEFYKENRKSGGRDYDADYYIEAPAVEEENYEDYSRFHPRTERDKKLFMVLLALGKTWVNVKYNR